MMKTIEGQQLTRRALVAGGIASVFAPVLTACGGGGELADTRERLRPMAAGDRTSTHNYGTALGVIREDRRMLALYRGTPEGIPSDTLWPVYIYAHQNGAHYINQAPPLELRKELNEKGIAVISWESYTYLNSTNQSAVLEDAALMLRWVIENGRALGLDPDRIVLGGQSRGTYASWVIGHDRANASRIKGMFMKNALPGSVAATSCGRAINTINGEAPAHWVTEISPKIRLIHHPADMAGECTDENDKFHSRANSEPVITAYGQRMIAEIIDVDSVAVMDNTLVDFVTSCLSASPPPNEINFSDYFNSSFNASAYETRAGTWDVADGALRQMNNSSYGYCGAGENAWANYTVTAVLMSLNSASPTSNAQVSRVVARFIDGNNFYEAFITKNGQLILQSKKAGAVRTIQSVQVGSVNVNNWNTLALKCNGNQLTVSLNGVAQATVSATDHSAGKAGVRSFACETRVDSLAILGIA